VIAIPAGLGAQGHRRLAAGQRAGADVSPLMASAPEDLESLAETARVTGVPG
jgi:hypothetical protein